MSNDKMMDAMGATKKAQYLVVLRVARDKAYELALAAIGAIEATETQLAAFGDTVPRNTELPYLIRPRCPGCYNTHALVVVGAVLFEDAKVECLSCGKEYSIDAGAPRETGPEGGLDS
jgi:hypothetical protein